MCQSPTDARWRGFESRTGLSSVLRVLDRTEDFREALTRHGGADGSLDRLLQALFEGCKGQESDATAIMERLDIKSGFEQVDAAECFQKILREVEAPGASQLFQGQLKKTHKCWKCGFKTSSEETFNSLPLDLTYHQTAYKLVDGVAEYFKQSVVSGANQLFCERCDAKCDAATCEIEHHPDVLMLQLKRFKFDSLRRRDIKIERYVEFPYMLEIPHAGAETEIYELYAFVKHFGEQRCGKFSATMKSEEDGFWYNFSESSTTYVYFQPSKADDSHRCQYVSLLFYRKVTPVSQKKENRGRNEERGGVEVRGEEGGGARHNDGQHADSERTTVSQNGDRAKSEDRQENGKDRGGNVKEDGNKESEEDKQRYDKKTGGQGAEGGPDQRGGDLRGQEESRRGGGGAVGSSSEASKLSTTDREQQAERRSLDEQLQILFEDLKKHAAETRNPSWSNRVDVQSDAGECFENILRNVSAPGVSQLFQGQMTHKTQCSKCRTLTSSEEPFSSLPLSFEASNKDYKVVDGVAEYFKLSVVSGENQLFCERCDAKRDAAAKCEIEHHPDVLLLRLRRFKFDGISNWHTRISRYVEFPCVLKIPHAGAETEIYELYAFTEHFGGYARGYHNVTIKSLDDGKWYDISGNYVSLVYTQPFKGNLSHSSWDVCLLFYRKVSIVETLGSVIRDVSASEKESKNREQQRDDDVKTAGGVEVRGQEGGTTGGGLREEEQMKKTGGEERAGGPDQRGGDLRGQEESSRGGGGAVGSSSEASKLSTTDREQQAERRSLDEQLQILFEDLKKHSAETRNPSWSNRVDVQSGADECFQKILRNVSAPGASQLFQGQLTHKTKCLKCGTLTTSEEPFWSLPLPFKESFKEYKVVDGVAEYFRQSVVSGANQLFCEHCDAKCDAAVKCEMVNHPEVLVLQLKRFKFDSITKWHTKIIRYVEFPCVLEIPHAGAETEIYELCAFIEHVHGYRYEHHNVTIKSLDDGKWYDIIGNDVSLVHTQPFKEDMSHSSWDVFLLFYRKVTPVSQKKENRGRNEERGGVEVRGEEGGTTGGKLREEEQRKKTEGEQRAGTRMRTKTDLYNNPKQSRGGEAGGGARRNEGQHADSERTTVSQNGDRAKSEDGKENGKDRGGNVKEDGNKESEEEKQRYDKKTGGQGTAGGPNQRGGGAVGSSSEASKLSTKDREQQPEVKTRASAPPPEPKYHGLYNQGATCYLNSVLQVLFMTPGFTEALHRHPCGDRSLDKELQNLFEGLKKQTAETKIITKSLGISKVDVQSGAAECFENILRNVSAPGASQLFQGQLTHKTQCRKCRTLTSSEEPFLSLPLSFEDSNKDYKVVDGVAEYFRQSVVSGENQLFCERCDAKCDAAAKSEMTHHPDVLMLRLGRFKFDSYYKCFKKIDRYVKFPYMLEIPHAGAETEIYELYAFVGNGGKYTYGQFSATIKPQDNGKWYNFSDHHVYVADFQPFKVDINHRCRDVCLLFYRKVSAAEQKQTGGQGAAGGPNQRGGGAVGSSSEASKLSTTVTKQQPTPVNSNLQVSSTPGTGHPAASVPPPEPKYHGLYNQGATCYLNSVLQVLFMTRDFREAVKRHPCGRPSLDKELQNLFEELRKQTAETRNITKSLGISRVDVQSDAAECFENILRNVSAPGASQLFQGQLTHMTQCLKCGTLTSSEEPFWNLPLELVAFRSDSYSHYSVVDGIAEYFGVSEVRGSDQLFCDRCAAKTDAKMKYEIKQHPQVLMLMLKRFKFNYTYMSYVKVKNSVVIPDSVKLPGGSGAPSEDYELYAFVEHVGELRHGHYTATIKSQSDGKWYHFNDSRVRSFYQHFQLDSSERCRDVYLLFYRKVTPGSQNKENRGRNEERGGEEVRGEEGGTKGGKLREEENRKKTEGEERAGTRMLTRADLYNNPKQSRGGEAGGGARHNDGQHAGSERTTVSQNGDRAKSEDRQENGKNRGGNVKEAGNKESEEEKQRYDKKTGGQGAEGGTDLHKGGDEGKQRDERELKRAEAQGQKTEEQRGAEGGAGKGSHTSKLSMILRRRPGKAVQVASENCQFIGSETRGDEERRYYLAPGQGNQRSGPDSGVSPKAPKPDLAGPRTAPPCRRTYSEVSQVPEKTPDDTKIQIESESSNGSAKKKGFFSLFK